MADNKWKKQGINHLICTLLGTIIVFLGPVMSSVNRVLAFAVLSAVSIIVYFCIVFTVADRNWLDIRAVFHGVWLFTIGLSSLRLMGYQEVWQNKTWYYLAIAYLVFEIGAGLGIFLGAQYGLKVYEKGKNFKLGRISFSLHSGRLYWICIITTLIGLVCFLLNVRVAGFIPAFSKSTTAYLDFYRRYHVFAVAATAIPGLCYYCIKTQALSWAKKTSLWVCIFYLTFLFPVLVVSRGTFLMSAISLLVCVFYLNKRKLWVLLAGLAVILSVYTMTSALRGYSDAALASIFEPSQITISNQNSATEQTGTDLNDEKEEQSENNVENDADNEADNDINENSNTFSLSPKLSFVYSYLTVSHDNFNEAVQNLTGYTYGARTLKPFNVIIRSDAIRNMASSIKTYKVRPHLNTVNFVGDFYYDFHVAGLVVFTLISALAFGMIQSICLITTKPFVLLAMGNTMVPVLLCFFNSWMSNFSLWMLWGTGVLCAIAACITLNSSQKSPSEKHNG